VKNKVRATKAQKPWGAVMGQTEKLKASVRAKVKHPFRVIKWQFGHTKVRCQKHPAADRLVCAVQYLDGEKPVFAEGVGISASANRQGTMSPMKYPWIDSKLYALTLAFQQTGHIHL
jgi:hypothetical protein